MAHFGPEMEREEGRWKIEEKTARREARGGESVN
jgi:hypothetical protein